VLKIVFLHRNHKNQGPDSKKQKNGITPKLLENKENSYRQPSKEPINTLISACTPLSTRPTNPLNTAKPTSGKSLWGSKKQLNSSTTNITAASSKNFQKNTPQNDIPKLAEVKQNDNKLSQKILPFTTMETELDCSIATNSTIGEQAIGQIAIPNNIAVPGKKFAESSVSEEQSKILTRSKSEERSTITISLKVCLLVRKKYRSI